MRAQARFLADDRRSRPSPLLVLEVLSRLLPDTVWLTEITLDGTRARRSPAWPRTPRP